MRTISDADIPALIARTMGEVLVGDPPELDRDFFFSGGLPALLNEIKPHLALNALTVTGKTLGENIADAQNLDAIFAALLTLLHQVEIDFAAAQHHALDLVIGHQLDGGGAGHHFGLVAQHAVERGSGGHVRQEAGAFFMAQQ